MRRTELAGSPISLNNSGELLRIFPKQFLKATNCSFSISALQRSNSNQKQLSKILPNTMLLAQKQKQSQKHSRNQSQTKPSFHWPHIFLHLVWHTRLRCSTSLDDRHLLSLSCPAALRVGTISQSTNLSTWT
ncbi:hypothetical protein RchiOBHm_Chr1g0322331 [Rosa chinensis]|uniref:Uncharacterized protein n=1 Tax=Rosa chinensis TaxID=74649 RepID=A0A2P6S984_ROSCH|nr:hypothetical protein RchiOBHm_Chr1g0322331 [Rosa chinensis]